MGQRLTSELVLKLTQQVSGPAAAARKSLVDVDKALIAISKRKDVEKQINALTASYDKQRMKLRELTNQVIAADKPTAALMRAHQAAERALDQTSKRITAQRAALDAAENGMRQFVGATEAMSAAEARLRSEATLAAEVIARATQREEFAARQRRSLVKEMAREASESAVANRRAAEVAIRLEERKTTALAREARKREAILQREVERSSAAAKRAADRQRAAEQRAAERARQRYDAAVGSTVGLGSLIVGPGLVTAGVDLVKAAATREERLNKIRVVSGGNEEEVRAAADIAGKASAAYPLTTQIDALGDYNELRSLAASSQPGRPIDLQKMRTNVMLMAQARAALAASGYSLGEGDAKALSTAIEATGRASDPEAQRKMLDAYVRAKQVFGNAFTPDMVRDFALNAKTSNFSASDPSFFFTTFARLAQGNASRLGNEFAQTMSTLVGGRMTKQGANWLANLGLINANQIRSGEGGKFYIEGGLAQSDLLSTDQTAWAQQVLLPAMEKSGVISKEAIEKRSAMLRQADPNADDTVIEERAIHGLIADSLAKSGFRSTVTDNLSHAIANAFQTAKDVEQMKASLGLDAITELGKDPVASFNELTSSIANFGSVLGAPVMKDAAAIMHNMARGFSELSTVLQDWQKNNPKSAEVVATAAPAALVAGGGYLSWLAGSSIIRSILGGAPAAAGGTGSAAVGGAAAAGTTIGASGLGRAVLKRLFGPLGIGFMVGEGLSYTDPSGNLWGGTSDIDAWVLKNWGFDPSKPGTDSQSFQKWLKTQVPLDSGPAAMPDPFNGTNPYNDPLKGSFAPPVAEGFEKQSSLVQEQARQLVASIQAIFDQGVNLPVRLDSSAVAAGAASARAAGDRAIDNMVRSTYADVEIG